HRVRWRRRRRDEVQEAREELRLELERRFRHGRCRQVVLHSVRRALRHAIARGGPGALTIARPERWLACASQEQPGAARSRSGILPERPGWSSERTTNVLREWSDLACRAHGGSEWR